MPVQVSPRAWGLVLFWRRGENLTEATAMCGGFARTVWVAGTAQPLQAAATGGLDWENAR